MKEVVLSVSYFGRQFAHLEPSFLQDLESLEREGATYTQFWQDAADDFRFCRIRFTPSEIVAYVDASVAYNEFLGLLDKLHDPEAALERVSDTIIRDRVRSYNEWTRSIGQFDTAYCFASFIGDHLEALV